MNGCNNQIKLFRLVFETRLLFNTHSRPQLEAENRVTAVLSGRNSIRRLLVNRLFLCSLQLRGSAVHLQSGVTTSIIACYSYRSKVAVKPLLACQSVWLILTAVSEIARRCTHLLMIF